MMYTIAMEIQRVYDQYKVPEHLQEHMLRVAGVGIAIGKHWIGPDIDIPSIRTALLIHDMGNIMKFDFTKPEQYQVNQHVIETWKRTQAEFAKNYGNSVHLVTMGIIQELSVSNYIIELVEAIGLDFVEETYRSDDIVKKLCSYADLRVDPDGVVTVDQRFDDLIERYRGRKDVSNYEIFRSYVLEMEQLLQPYVSIPLAGIDNSLVSGYLPELRKTAL